MGNAIIMPLLQNYYLLQFNDYFTLKLSESKTKVFTESGRFYQKLFLQ